MIFKLFNEKGMLIDDPDVIIDELDSSSYITADEIDYQDSNEEYN